MKRIIKKIFILLFAVIIGLTPLSIAEAKDNTTYQPLDLVVIVDSSGSMKKADEDKIVLQSVSSLISMMPTDSQLGIVSFKEDATTIADLTSLDSYSNADSLKKSVKEVEYDGKFTAIGNALAKSKEVINGKNSRKNAQKAIILFTDGTDDLQDTISQETNNENLNDTIAWASQNNCPIYTIGFNYKNSMSSGQEGIKKLEKISSLTNALTPKVANNDISEIEDYFIDILANVCGIQYSVGKTINVNSAVSEVDIHIKASSKEEMDNGIIHLIDPDNKEIKLQNNDTLQYSQENKSAFIKLIKPKVGEWNVNVENFNGEVIVTYIQHYTIDLSLELPKTVYKGSDITFKAQLIDQKGNNVKEDVYESLTTTKATITERLHPDDVTEVDLQYENGYLVGSYTVKDENTIDIEVSVVSDSINKKVSGEIHSTIKPLELKEDNTLEKISVNKGKKKIIENIISDYIDDNGQEYVTAKVEVEDSNIAKVSLDEENERLTIEGIKFGSTLATITYTDAQNNCKTMSISIKVKDWTVIAKASVLPIIIIILVISMIIFAFEKTRKINGEITMGPMTIKKGNTRSIFNKVSVPGNVIFRRKKTLKQCLRYYIEQTKNNDNSDEVRLLSSTFDQHNEFEELFNQIKVKGSYFGKKGFTLKLKKNKNIGINNRYGQSCKRKVTSKGNFKVCVKNDSNVEVTLQFNYVNKRIRNQRNIKKSRQINTNTHQRTNNSKGRRG